MRNIKPYVLAILIVSGIAYGQNWTAPPSNSAFLAGAGTKSAPAYSFAADSQTGMFIPSASTLSLAVAGTSQIRLGPDIQRWRSTATIGWASGDADATSYDTTLSRASAGLARVGTGTANALGGLTLTLLQMQNGVEPACSSTTRGTLIHVYGATGVKDTVRICAKDVADAYAYRTLY